MVNGKKFLKKFFTLSENDEDVVGFSVTPSTMVLPVGDLVAATFSIEMCDPFHKRVVHCFSLFLWFEFTGAIT